MSRDGHATELSPDLLLRAYAAGIFPMSEARDDDRIFWVDPEYRGILPLDSYHIARSLKKTVRKQHFDIRFDTAFETVLDLCADTAPDRENTWINQPIRNAVIELHEMGFAHSVETWREGKLVGGLYGIALGAAFFGESMFSRQTNASKVALVHLLAVLKFANYQLLDTQFVTDHLSAFGVMEIPSSDYLERLEAALRFQSHFPSEITKSQLKSAVEHVLDNSTKQTFT